MYASGLDEGLGLTLMKDSCRFRVQDLAEPKAKCRGLRDACELQVLPVAVAVSLKPYASMYLLVPIVALAHTYIHTYIHT